MTKAAVTDAAPRDVNERDIIAGFLLLLLLLIVVMMMIMMMMLLNMVRDGRDDDNGR